MAALPLLCCCLSLRVEYADLSFIDTNSPPWYRHGTFRSGYVYDGHIIGHHAGSAAKDLYFEATANLPADLTLTLALDLEKRGYDQPVLEEHVQPMVKVAWNVGNATLSADYAYDRISNFAMVKGDDRSAHLLRVGVSGGW